MKWSLVDQATRCACICGFRELIPSYNVKSRSQYSKLVTKNQNLKKTVSSMQDLLKSQNNEFKLNGRRGITPVKKLLFT